MLLFKADKVIFDGIAVSVINRSAGVGIGTNFRALINAVFRNPGIINQLFNYTKLCTFGLAKSLLLKVLNMFLFLIGGISLVFIFKLTYFLLVQQARCDGKPSEDIVAKTEDKTCNEDPEEEELVLYDRLPVAVQEAMIEHPVLTIIVIVLISCILNYMGKDDDE